MPMMGRYFFFMVVGVVLPAQAEISGIVQQAVKSDGLKAEVQVLDVKASLNPELEAESDGHGFTSILVEVICFGVAFAAIRKISTAQQAKGKATARKKVCDSEDASATQVTSRRISERGPASMNALRLWAGRLLHDKPSAFVEEFVGHLRQHSDRPQYKDAVNILLDILGKAGRPDLVEAFAKAAGAHVGEVDASHLKQALLSASAVTGDVDKVEESLEEERRNGQVAMRSFASVVRGYMKCGKLQEAVAKLCEMRSAGHEVPSRAVAELAQLACGRSVAPLEVLAWLDGKLDLPSEALSVLLEQCAQSDDPETAAKIEEFAIEKKVPIVEAGYESLLKVYSKVSSAQAQKTFEAIQAAGFQPSEGLCRFLIARSADSRNLLLANSVADYLRNRKEMTFSAYKALMKVYAFSGLYDKACDLYAEITAAGMEPDSVMYGSLVKFAVKAGRHELSQECFAKADNGNVQNYMWLIRDAGGDGNVDAAISTFRKLQENRPELVDTMAFNILIDVCASNKDMARAKELLEEMRAVHPANLVTYNTLLKGYSAIGEVKSARNILREMEEAGVTPDSASFSCLLSGAAKLGDLPDVWKIMAEMDRRGLTPDSYVLSILMQTTRKTQNARDADRLLAILDRPDIKICEDEVVFNTVLDACIYRRDHRRLARAVEAYPGGKMKSGVRTFGLLIKACSVLRRTARCWEFWKEMVEARGIAPNDITLGCMIDALVEAQQVDVALALFQEWKPKVHCDTIIYSTLIKGFSNLGDAERAMALFKDMKTNGVQMNHIVFTTLINAHSRNGLMAKAESLLEDMQKEGCQPNTITYSALVKGHCVKGDLEAALTLFHKMLDVGLAADTVIFNTLLDGCVQKSNFVLADELLGEMEKSKVTTSNYTLSILVKMWSKRGQLDKAFACVREALQAPDGKRRVDAQVGACIVGACIHNRSPKRAIEVFQEMKTWPHFDGPDANTYSAMISGLPRYGYLQKAVELAEEACTVLCTTSHGQDKRPLASNAIQQLFKALKTEGLLQEVGRPLASRLRKAGMTVEKHWLGNF